MKRLFNIRIPVIIALFLCLGILVGVTLYFFSLHLAWITVAVGAAAVIFIIWFLIKRKLLSPAIYVVLFLAFFLTGGIYGYCRLADFDYCEAESEAPYEICGTVTEKGEEGYANYIIIDNVTLDGRHCSGKVYVILSNDYGEYCNVGYTVKFSSSLEKYDAFSYGEINYNVYSNIKYSSAVYTGLTSEYGFSLFGTIRSAFKRVLFDNLNSESAAVCLGMLTGDTTYINYNTIQSFRYGGVAHIFAVSGLHIGIIYGIIAFICSKLRLNRYISAAVCLAPVFFYVGICGFTVSSVRAAVMCACHSLARVLFKKNDGLNTLATAVIVLLLIDPLSLTAVGFQLSVCAVGGIAVTADGFSHILRKIKTPKKIRSTASSTVGAQLGVTPVMLSRFGYLSVAGLLVNIIVLPLFSLLYTILFAGTLLSLIIPVAAPFILPNAALPVEAIISLIVGTGFENAVVTGFGAGAFVPLFFIALIMISDKINLKTIKRLIAVAVSVVLLAGYTLIRYYSPFCDYELIVSYGYGGEVLLRSHGNYVLILTDGISPSQVKQFLSKYYSCNISSVIILGNKAANLSGIGCHDVYAFSEEYKVNAYGVPVYYASSFVISGVEYNFIDEYNLSVAVNGVKIFIASDGSAGILDSSRERTANLFIGDENRTCQADRQIAFSDGYSSASVYRHGDYRLRINGTTLYDFPF